MYVCQALFRRLARLRGVIEEPSSRSAFALKLPVVKEVLRIGARFVFRI